MAVKIQRVTITEEGRDAGKTFVIREMPADQAEMFGWKVILSLTRSGVDIPDDLSERDGLAAVVALGVRALGGVRFEDAKELLDEMFACISIAPDQQHPEVVRALVDSDIEEVSTRIKLRAEVYNVHVGFSILGRLRQLILGKIEPEVSGTTRMLHR